MKRVLIIAALFIVIAETQAQELQIKNNRSGIFSIGGRTSISLVNDGQWQKTAFGTGGQFGIMFSDRIGSEWFIDHLKADLKDFAYRADTHIGWSLMYYLTEKQEPLFQPYVLAGHCFEYLKFTENANESNFAERWSASIQGGFGAQLNVTKRFDICFTAQYLMHFGTKITASNNDGIVTFTKRKGYGIHDHILFHLGLNYKIADLW